MVLTASHLLRSGMEITMIPSSILSDLKSSYGISCHDAAPIDGGWMNQLWKISSNRGELLIKRFSLQRYTRQKLAAIESSLQRQILLEKEGIPCPHIHPYGASAIRFLDDDTAYMVMDFQRGKNQSSASVTLSQMESLGEVCARMHRAFSRFPVCGTKGYPIDGRRFLASLWDTFHTRAHILSQQDPPAYRRGLLAMGSILPQLTEDFFDRLPKGIAHEDFTFDNILFQEDGVSAVLDFDRNQYSFVWHDIGRALLCFALHDEILRPDYVQAFSRGYNRYLPLTRSDLADALRITWCIETVWWIQPDYFTMEVCKATRFRDEILWLTAHWDEMDRLLP